MDITHNKLKLIEWLAGIDDIRIIKQIEVLKNLSSENEHQSISIAEKSAIDKGLKSIEEGNVHSDDSVKEAIKNKYPHLFK
jgi:hypothetical protein